ncbi:conserved hypothetical protein [Histoplasma capsulatum H143]|uniref:Uncharacterized protein n=1 Tax=Ajellomyces capsulatus (strain H143) TaxID=544712 RepID=C6HNK4_AJECH|nr:conserved hypothetical protein [Histoplasma capsulatum H143]
MGLDVVAQGRLFDGLVEVACHALSQSAHEPTSKRQMLFAAGDRAAIMHFLKATAFLLAALSMQTVSAIPARNGYSSTPDCPVGRSSCKPGESGVLRVPEMRAMVDGKPSEKIGHYIKLSKAGDKKHDQQMTFDVPKGAKHCTIKWDQGEKRKFVVKDSGLVRIYPTEPSGAESVGSADFTNWPQQKGYVSHLVTSVECQEKLSLLLSLDYDGSVKMEQDATNVL